MPVPMKSKSAPEWLRYYYGIFENFTSRVFKPKLQTLDNEESAALKNYFTEKDTSYQLVPRTVTLKILQNGPS